MENGSSCKFISTIWISLYSNNGIIASKRNGSDAPQGKYLQMNLNLLSPIVIIQLWQEKKNWQQQKVLNPKHDDREGRQHGKNLAKKNWAKPKQSRIREGSRI